MALPLMAIAKGAVAAAPILSRLFSRKSKQPSAQPIIDRYKGYRPEGWVTDQDRAFVDRQKQAGFETVGSQVRGARSAAAGRMAARGLALSPAAERVQEDITQGESAALTGVERAGADTLYKTYAGNRAYDASKAAQVFAAEMGEWRRKLERQDLRRSTFLNSLTELYPNVFAAFSGGGTPAPAPGNTLAGASELLGQSGW